MKRPYTRSLDPQDYDFLPHAEPIRQFQRDMKAPHCISHPHKVWENASIMQQLDELGVPKDAYVIDVGSGGMFFPPYLAAVGGYRDLTLTDSMHNMDIRGYVTAQNVAYGLNMVVHALHAENMASLPSDHWDVVMCISVIEHINKGSHDAALKELWRLTKPGGLIFITSDYFRGDGNGGADSQQYQASPYKDGQETAYNKELVLNLPNIIDVEFVGDTDLDYRGDFVHNYSFCNICLRKPASTTPRGVDNGKGDS